MENDSPSFDNRSAEERLAQAEAFESLAEKFKDNPKLSEASGISPKTLGNRCFGFAADEDTRWWSHYSNG